MKTHVMSHALNSTAIDDSEHNDHCAFDRQSFHSDSMNQMPHAGPDAAIGQLLAF